MWVVFFRTWRRQDRRRFYGRAQPRRKSTVAMLKRSLQPQRTGRLVLDASSSTRQLGLRIPGYGAKIVIDFTEELHHSGTNPMCSFHSNSTAQCQTSRPKSVAQRNFDGDSQQRSPNAPNSEDRCQEETEWQEHWAREAAWKLAKKILKLNEKHNAAFFSPTEKWCLPSPSTIIPEERVCGGLQGVDAHDKQKGSEFCRVGDCSDFQVSTVITANEEVQTHDEATVYVRETGYTLDCSNHG